MVARRVAALALMSLLAGAAPAAAAPLETSLMSRASGTNGAKGGGDGSWSPSISADGRYVAFQSRSQNLHPDDTDTLIDVYVRDRQTDTTTLVSRATGATGVKGNSHSSLGQISGNGRYVVFSSDATNLTAPEGVTWLRIYVRDLQTNTTIVASRADGAAGDTAFGNSNRPSISSDGSRVAFLSEASNLVAGDVAFVDVFVRDVVAGTTTLASRADGATGDKANGHSSDAAIAANGDHVAFLSGATNLDPDDTDTTLDVHVRDLSAATTTLASRATGATGAKGNQDALEPSISGDGSRVAFETTAGNLSPDDGNGNFDVYVRDLAASTTILVSRAGGTSGAVSNLGAVEPSIASGGGHVAFSSQATNLTAADTDSTFDVFVRDLAASTTTLASRASGSSGEKGNGGSILYARLTEISSGGHLSSNGSMLAFRSAATNLSPADTDNTWDVYFRDTTLPPSRTLTVARTGGGSGRVTGTGIDCGADCNETVTDGTTVELTATPDSGSAFAGFTGGGCGSTSPCTVTLDADKTVQARFEPIQRTLTVTRSGSGSGRVAGPGIDCGDGGVDCTETVAHGTVVNLAATPSGGSSFAGFSGGGCGTTSPCAVTMDADKTVDASFGPPSRTLTVTTSGTGGGFVSGPGIDCGGAGRTDCTETVADGTTIALTANPATGSNFTGYTGGGCGTTSPCTVTMDASKTVNATFTSDSPPPPPPARTLTVTTSGTGSGTVTGTGIDCGGGPTHTDCSETVADGTAITLSAGAGLGSTFAGYTGGGCGAASTCTVTMNADRTVDARFDLAPPPPPPPPPIVPPGFPNIGAIVCPILHTLRASLPPLPGLTAIIDSLLAAFGCAPAPRIAAAGREASAETGTVAADVLRGSPGNDLLDGREGGDRLAGGGGRDVVLGAAGNDRAQGGAGGDLLMGDAGRDRLAGGAGTDILVGGAGPDRLDSRDRERDYLICGRGRDQVLADRRDRVARDCERVSRRQLPPLRR